MSVSRRGFLKFGLGAALAGAVSGLGFNLRPAFAQAKEFKLKWTKQTTSICCYCAVGCGLIVSTSTSDNPLGKGRAINVEGDPDHPINEGSLCPKGASTWQLTVNDQRPKKPLYRAPHATEWKEVEWEWAMEEIAKRVKESRDKSFTEKNDKGQLVNRSHGFVRFRRNGQRGVLGLSVHPPQPRPGVYRTPGAPLTQRHCYGSGRVVRTRRDDESLDRSPAQ